MSCFMVSDRTMQRAVTAMKRDYWRCEDCDDLGRKLWRMNADACQARYGRDDTDNLAEHDTWTWRGNGVLMAGEFPAYTKDACRLMKSLSCLIYQCSEGDVMKRDLYKELKERRQRLALHIVANLREYDDADWD